MLETDHSSLKIVGFFSNLQESERRRVYTLQSDSLSSILETDESSLRRWIFSYKNLRGSLSIPWRQILFSSIMLLKKTDALILAYVVQSSVDSSRRYWTRKLIQSNVRPPCGEQWNMCRGKRKSSYKTTTVSPSPEGLPIRNENLLASYRLPRRSVAAAAHFESNRMVPTGPNPLHNSNRSQVIFPWRTPWW